MEAEWGIALAAFVSGLLFGLAVGRLSAQRERSSLRADLDAAKAETESLRSATADHFNRAGELFADLTERYVSFYRHLARGAETLSNGRTRKFPGEIVVPAREDEAETERIDG